MKSTVLRYAGAFAAVVLSLALFLLIPDQQTAGIAVLIVLVAWSWFGGTGPAILAPSLLVVSLRLMGGVPRMLEFTQKEVLDLIVVFLLTTAVGWSGQAWRRARAVTLQQAAKLREQGRALGLAHVVFRDFDGRISEWNDGMYRMYGWAPEEAEGQVIHDLLRTRFPKPLEEINAELARDGQWQGELAHTGRDGTEIVVASHWILYRSESRDGARVAEVNHDVTALRRAEQRVREADHRKDQFLAMLAHELRNPLAPIRTGLEILSLGEGPAAGPDFNVLEIMRRQVDHMVRLIDDLLDLSRINTGKIELRREAVALADIVRDAVDSSRPHVDAARHTLAVDLPSEPVLLHADRARLSQVLLNILNNAAKFTPPGGQISLSAVVENGQVELAVRDTGMGIHSEMLPRVFEMFSQGEQTLERVHGGLGIGLSIVRTVVEMHGGSVEAKSAGPGHGSEFVVRLPRLAEAPPAYDALPAACQTDRALV